MVACCCVCVLEATAGKGATEAELVELRSSVKVPVVAVPSLGEAKAAEDEKPAWARAEFFQSMDDTDYEDRIKAVGEFQRRYLNQPSVRVRYRNVRFTAKFDPSEPDIKTVANSNPIGAVATKVMYKMSKRNEPTTRAILRGCSGVIEPGTLTLVIGAPGCGKTSFLKMLAGLLQKKTATSTLAYDECTYNGEDVYAAKRKFVPSKVATYIDQIDIHTPTLTVEETFKFAFDTLGAQDAAGITEKKRELFREASKKKNSFESTLVSYERQSEVGDFEHFVESAAIQKLETILRILGIEHVRHTIVGNAQIRGVSGGQRRRVSVGEALMGKCRLMAGDEISTGLDSQTAFEITHAFKMLATHIGVTVVLSLLQPAPETFALFDQVILLDRGAVAYHGPTERITAHFAGVGLEPPPRKDVADFLVEITSSAELRAEYCTLGEGRKPVNDLPACFTVDTCPEWAAMTAKFDEEKPAVGATDWGPYYSTEFTKPMKYYLALCLRRTLIVMKLNPAYMKTKFGQAVFMGIFTGTLYYQVDYDDFSSKFGLCFSALMFLALSGMSAMPVLIDRRAVFYKQRAASFFPTLAYTSSQIVIDSVVVLAENIIYVNLVYWPAGLASSGFFVFFVICVALSLAMNQWFAAVAAAAPDTQSAQPMAGMSVVLCVLFSGFIIQRPNLPQAWRPLYWVSPIALGWRAASINEFRSDKYDKCTYQRDEVCREGEGGDDGCCSASSDGIFFLERYSVQSETSHIAISIIVLAAYFLLSVCLQTLFLTYVRHSGHGAGPPVPDDDVADPEASIANMRLPTKALVADTPNDDDDDESSSAIPYTPTTIAFKDVHYTVSVPSSNPFGPSEQLELLGGVTGFAKPATLTALMGSRSVLAS